jgi:hypothetical protein
VPWPTTGLFPSFYPLSLLPIPDLFSLLNSFGGPPRGYADRGDRGGFGGGDRGYGGGRGGYEERPRNPPARPGSGYRLVVTGLAQGTSWQVR